MTFIILTSLSFDVEIHRQRTGGGQKFKGVDAALFQEVARVWASPSDIPGLESASE